MGIYNEGDNTEMTKSLDDQDWILKLHCNVCLLNGNAELTSCPCDCHNGVIKFD